VAVQLMARLTLNDNYLSEETVSKDTGTPASRRSIDIRSVDAGRSFGQRRRRRKTSGPISSCWHNAVYNSGAIPI
jgi:hypothetical protein